MAVRAFDKGKLIDEWSEGSVKVRVYDGAFVAKTQDDPKITAIIGRIAQLGLIVAAEKYTDE